MQNIIGNFQVNENLELIGWVHDPTNPEKSLCCNILVDGQLVTSIVADAPRPDLGGRFAFTRIGIFLALDEFAELKEGSVIQVIDAETGRSVPPAKVVLPKSLSKPIAAELDLESDTSALVIRRTRHGFFILNRFDRGVDFEMLKYGEYAESEVRLLTSLLPPQAIAVDVGANIGALTVPLARHLVEDGMVYSFEPQLNVFYRLCGNVAINGITNVAAVHAAVGAGFGTAIVPRVNYASSHSSGGVAIKQKGEGEKVSLVSLDGFDFGSGRVALVKIDVEGFEAEVVEGARALIKKDLPAVYFECRSQANFRRIHDFLSELGYRFFWHPAPLFEADNFAAQTEDHYFGAGINSNILAAPADIRPGDEHGLYEMEGHAEFWPAHRFPPAWRDKIANWAKNP